MFTDANLKFSDIQVVPVTASTITPSTNQIRLGSPLKTNLGATVGPTDLVARFQVDVAPAISTNANGSGAEPAVIFQLRSSVNADMTGNIIIAQSRSFRPGVSAWAVSTAYTQGTVAAKTGHVRRPTVANGFQYRCTTSGTSAASEPTWPTVPGTTVVDNTATWTCEAAIGGQLVAGQEIDFVCPVPGNVGPYIDVAYSVGATALDSALSITAMLTDGPQVNYR